MHLAPSPSQCHHVASIDRSETEREKSPPWIHRRESCGQKPPRSLPQLPLGTWVRRPPVLPVSLPWTRWIPQSAAGALRLLLLCSGGLPRQRLHLCILPLPHRRPHAKRSRSGISPTRPLRSRSENTACTTATDARLCSTIWTLTRSQGCSGVQRSPSISPSSEI